MWLNPHRSSSAAYSPLHMRHNLRYATFWRFRRTMSHEPFYKGGEFQQVRHAEECPLLSQDDIRIRCGQIRPPQGNRTHGLSIDLQQKAHTGAVAPLAHASELSAGVGVERMNDPHKPRGCDGNVRILNPGTSGSSRRASACRRTARRASRSRRRNCRSCSTASAAGGGRNLLLLRKSMRRISSPPR